MMKLLISAFFAHGYTNKVAAMLTTDAVGLPAFAGSGRGLKDQFFDVGFFVAVGELGRNGLFGGRDAGRNNGFWLRIHGKKVER